MTAEQKVGLKPPQVYTLMRVSWGERCTEQKTSETAEAVGAEGISVVPFYPKEDAHALKMFAWQLPASRAHRHKTGCDAMIRSDAEICLRAVTIMRILDTAHCILEKQPRPSSR